MASLLRYRALAVAASLGLAGCVDNQPYTNAGAVNSLEVQLLAPANLGSPMAPVTAQQATYNVIARDANGGIVKQNLKVDVFVSFGGIKTGADSACGADASGNNPIETITLNNGALMNHTTQLPSAFGSTSVWLDEPVSHATGASPTIYFRNPYVSELQTPVDLTAPNASFCSPFNNKYVVVDHAENGGQLIVTSVYSGAFSVTDTGSTSFNNIFIFSFSQPPPYIVPGKVISSFSGNYSKFIGFTEINFPLFNAANDSVPLVPVPQPVTLAYADLSNIAKLLGANSGTVSYTGTICDPSPPNPNNDPNIQKTIQSWQQYDQFVIDNDGTCDSFTNFAVELTAKQMGTFDPTKQIGNKLTVVGMLQNHSGQNPVVDAQGNQVSCSATQACPSASNACINGDCFKSAYNFWTILPRTPDDVTVTPAPGP